MLNENNDKVIKQLLIEEVVIFLLIIIGLFIETYQRGILFINQSLNFDVAKLVISKTLLTSIIFVPSYGIIRSRFYPFYRALLSKANKDNPTGSIFFLTNIFLITSLILTSVRIRPIIQETFLESNISDFEYFLVKQDFLFSVITLIIIAIPLIWLIYKKEKIYAKSIKISFIILIIIVVGFANGLSNFSGRISETRATWIERNWQQQSIDGQKALTDSKTNEEKAAAYYWLGVAENRKNNYEKAKEYQLTAIKLRPEYYAAYASLSNSYLYLGEVEKSLQSSQKCIEFGPDYAWCYQSLMNYYLFAGDITNAKMSALKATQLNPKNKELKKIYEEVKEY